MKFPEGVQWMVLEFDPLCGTAQVEDYLQLYIPVRSSTLSFLGCTGAGTVLPESSASSVNNEELTDWWPVLKKFHGTDFPTMALVLPGVRAVIIGFVVILRVNC